MNTYSAIIVSGLPQNGLVIVDSSFTNAAAFIALALGSGRVVAGSETTTYTIKHMWNKSQSELLR
jgi:hypothetical protein